MAMGSLNSLEAEERPQYANKLELILSLVGYAVGLGNVWRFPYLAFTYGGASFLIPYLTALVMMGLPLFIMELGLGQLTRKGTVDMWAKIDLPRWKGVGVAATVMTWLCSLYYIVILSWTFYYMGATVASIPSGVLPWTDDVEGYKCAQNIMYPRIEVANNTDLVDVTTGWYNQEYKGDIDFWCPKTGIPTLNSLVPEGYVLKITDQRNCPAKAAVDYWSKNVLQQTSGMTDFGGFQPGLVVSYTLCWIMVFLIICKGIGSSGKVVYVTATLPYVGLVAFFIRAITLPNAWAGVMFFLKPDLSKLLDFQIWQRAATQIFYSLGMGWGSLIAFASYGDKKDDFAGNAIKVSTINCGTSIFAGLVVFPILGYLASEMDEVNPCIDAHDLNDLSSIGLQGTGLAFIAFPIAISRMPGGFFWAFLFFLMLLCLGIDSQFAMLESVMTVIHDSKVAEGMYKPKVCAIVCGVSWLIGLVFVTRAGIYWFNLFDYYIAIVGMWIVLGLECIGLMWVDPQVFTNFAATAKEWTGVNLGSYYRISWKFVCPFMCFVLLLLAFISIEDGQVVFTFDFMGALKSKPYPEGTGLLPAWSIAVGWLIGLAPVIVGALTYIIFKPTSEASLKRSDGAVHYGACNGA